MNANDSTLLEVDPSCSDSDCTSNLTQFKPGCVYQIDQEMPEVIAQNCAERFSSKLSSKLTLPRYEFFNLDKKNSFFYLALISCEFENFQRNLKQLERHSHAKRVYYKIIRTILYLNEPNETIRKFHLLHLVSVRCSLFC